MSKRARDDISEHCSQSISEAIEHKSSIPHEEEEQMRKEYLVRWPKFDDVKSFIDDIIKGLIIDGKPIKFSSEEQELLTDHGSKKISKYAFIGRTGDCDIIIKDTTDISRIQCVIIFTEEKIYVVDWWSILGTKTLHAGPTSELLHSLPKDRRILEFGINETFQLKFSDNIKFIVGRNECGICFNAPSCVRLECDHSLCDKCANRIDKCPYCRNTINQVNCDFSQCHDIYKVAK